jgi:menaquinone-specific isochorismate synthase
MLAIPGKHRPEHEREDLLALLALCARQAATKHQPTLLSITLRVRHIDPLAVLLSTRKPHDWHAYFEHPASDTAIAGMDAAWQAAFHGPSRFTQARDATRALLENAVCAGETDAPFAGPQFFAAFAFEDELTGAPFPFAPANLFLPRWQVARHDGTYTSVANVLIDESTPLETTADRILAAHKRYRNFEYSGSQPQDTPPSPLPGEGSIRHTPFLESGGAWYADGIKQALEQIACGGLRKVVLARTWHAGHTITPDLGRTLEHLRERYPACHTFSFTNGNGATFIGATPECLATVSGNQLHTEAIAGTAPRGIHAGEDARLGAGLLCDEKERREHNAVVEGILDALKTVGIEAREGSPARLVPLSNVQHLRTPITAPLPPGVHLLDIAAALHPTPATGGLPRAVALETIRSLEPAPRGLYAGPLGWFGATGEGRLVVGLRSALAVSEKNGNDVTLYAGAGIVPGATPEHELAETEAKMRAMAEAIE